MSDKKGYGIFKIIAALLAIGAVVTLVVVFHREIVYTYDRLKARVERFFRPEEYDDFADVD